MSGKISRRNMLKLGAMASAGAALAACQPAPTPTPEAPVVEAPEPTKVPEEPTVEEPAKATDVPVEQPPSTAEGKVVVMHYRQEFTEDDMNLFMEQNPGITLEFVDATDLTVFYAMYAAGTSPRSRPRSGALGSPVAGPRLALRPDTFL